MAAVAGAAAAAPSVATTSCNPAAADRVTQVVAAMDAALDAGDYGRYLTHIDPDRPLLLAEQRAWAGNLRSKPPTEIDFVLREAAELEFSPAGDWAEANVLLAWTPAFDPEAPEASRDRVEVPFRARFEPMFAPMPGKDVNQAEAAEAIGLPASRWVFAGVAWEVELTAPDGSTLLAFEQHRAMAEELLEILPGALAGAAACFGTETPVATVKLYPRMDLLNASISTGLSAPIAGWNEPNESIKLAAPALGFSAVAVLTHEAAHAVQFAWGEKPLAAPWWVLEGSAERAASLAQDEQDWPRVDRVVRDWAANNQLADFAELAEYDERLPAGAMRAYIQGHHFIRYLDTRQSTKARNAWLKFLLDGATLDEASQLIYQRLFAELDQSWRSTLANSDDPED